MVGVTKACRPTVGLHPIPTTDPPWPPLSLSHPPPPNSRGNDYVITLQRHASCSRLGFSHRLAFFMGNVAMLSNWHGQCIFRAATGVLSNIDQKILTKKKTRISTKYWPHSTLLTKYWPQKFLKKCAFTQKKRISTKYRLHSTLSTKYRPQKFLKKCAFTLFTFKSWDIHISYQKQIIVLTLKA